VHKKPRFYFPAKTLLMCKCVGLAKLYVLLYIMAKINFHVRVKLVKLCRSRPHTSLTKITAQHDTGITTDQHALL